MSMKVDAAVTIRSLETSSADEAWAYVAMEATLDIFLEI